MELISNANFPLYCSECKAEKDAVVELVNDIGDYLALVHVCRGCLLAAAALIPESVGEPQRKGE